jgi:tRNA(fMet)-specific endonuclease VapC
LDWLLDTSIAILLRDGDSGADRRVEAMHSRPMLSVLTQVELEGGVGARPEFAVARRGALDTLLRLLVVLPFDSECAAAYRRIVETPGYSRRKVVDRMIAATALAHGLGVVTANGADFVEVPGLAVEVWPISS